MHNAALTEYSSLGGVALSLSEVLSLPAQRDDQLLRRHGQLNRDRSPRFASFFLGSFSTPCSKPGTIEGDWPSNSRSRSICILIIAGSSGSTRRHAFQLSPISCEI